MKKLLTIESWVIMITAVFWGCDATPELDKNVEAQIINNWDMFIEYWHNQDAAACAAFYADDGINVPSDYVINKGPEAIEGFYRFLFENNISSHYTHSSKYVSAESRTAVEFAEFNVDWLSNDSTEWNYNARVLVHWEKNLAGEWKIKAFLFNSPPKQTTQQIDE